MSHCQDTFRYERVQKKGDTAGVAGVSRDITDIVNAESALHETIEELEKWQKATVGREVKMIELKKEIKELKRRLGKN